MSCNNLEKDILCQNANVTQGEGARKVTVDLRSMENPKSPLRLLAFLLQVSDIFF